MNEKAFTVATYLHERENRKPLITAYTRYFNEAWEGCKMYELFALNGTQAKKMAIDLRKRDEGLK